MQVFPCTRKWIVCASWFGFPPPTRSASPSVFNMKLDAWWGATMGSMSAGAAGRWTTRPVLLAGSFTEFFYNSYNKKYICSCFETHWTKDHFLTWAVCEKGKVSHKNIRMSACVSTAEDPLGCNDDVFNTWWTQNWKKNQKRIQGYSTVKKRIHTQRRCRKIYQMTGESPAGSFMCERQTTEKRSDSNCATILRSTCLKMPCEN